MNAMPGDLTIEQQFTLQVLKSQVTQLTLEEAQEYVIAVLHQMMIKENLMRHLFKAGSG
jgi:hypothetical protein